VLRTIVYQILHVLTVSLEIMFLSDSRIKARKRWQWSFRSTRREPPQSSKERDCSFYESIEQFLLFCCCSGEQNGRKRFRPSLARVAVVAAVLSAERGVAVMALNLCYLIVIGKIGFGWVDSAHGLFRHCKMNCVMELYLTKSAKYFATRWKTSVCGYLGDSCKYNESIASP
jgi:hypothetical protein